MRRSLRTLVLLLVLGGSTLAAKLSAPLCPIEPQIVPAPPVAERDVKLPADWCSRILPYLASLNPRMDPAEIEALLLAVDRSSRRFDVDPLTILAVIQVESQFDRFAVSPRNATGLMQLRADTARSLAEDLSIPWESDDVLYDIETNILLGTCYLRDLRVRFGNLDDSLAAFHAGPSFVESRRQRSMSVSLAYSDRVWDAIVILERTVLA